MMCVANQQFRDLNDETPPRWKRDGAGTSTVVPDAPDKTRTVCLLPRVSHKASGASSRRFVL